MRHFVPVTIRFKEVEEAMMVNHSFVRQVLRLLVIAGICVCLCPSAIQAQINNELRDLYAEMIPQFSGELQEKLVNARDAGQDFIELTGDQFKDFRDHPANPFDGWDGIDPDRIDGIIRLQFETQPVRSRQPGNFERQSEEQLTKLDPALAKVAPSIVKIVDGKKQRSYGIVVTRDGYIVSKASELKGAEKLFCKTYLGEVLEATIVNEDLSNDLALLKVSGARFTPVVWADNQPMPGAFLISPNQEGQSFAMGVYSHVPRSLIGKDQAFLGVKPQATDEGLFLATVNENGSADLAGIQAGDVLLSMDNTQLKSVTDLVNAVRARKPGDEVVLKFIRNGVQQETIAVLAGRSIPNLLAQRLESMKKFGAIPSERSDDFPLVLQHDTPLLPEQCGGPLVDLEGNVVGVNIARSGRVASYAIPSNQMRTLVNRLITPTVAQAEQQSNDRK